MSPTMTEGGIAGWKKAEGESFAAGDVLLEVVRTKLVTCRGRRGCGVVV
jgi:pyruvate dehydrogenase E2 component (dihydrolipoamide acetyltransferase)